MVPGRVASLRLTLQQTVHGHVPIAGIARIPVRRAGIGIDTQVIEALVQVPHGLIL
jgi:hypothetical protein